MIDNLADDFGDPAGAVPVHELHGLNTRHDMGRNRRSCPLGLFDSGSVLVGATGHF